MGEFARSPQAIGPTSSSGGVAEQRLPIGYGDIRDQSVIWRGKSHRPSKNSAHRCHGGPARGYVFIWYNRRVSIPVRNCEQALVPESETSPVFQRYRGGAYASVLAAFFGPFTAITLAAVVMIPGTPMVAMGLLAGAVTGVYLAMQRMGQTNRSLRRRLARALGVRGKGVFVGLRAMQGTLLSESLRTETDDNVGFLQIEERRLLVHTEAQALVLDIDEIRGFLTEPVVALPYLFFIRVELMNGDSFLVTSREGDTLRGMRGATETLRGRLVKWHADHQLAWLESGRLEL